MTSLPVQILWDLHWVSVDFPDWLFEIHRQLIQAGGGRIVTANSEIVMQAQTNPKLKQVLAQAEYCLPDGVGNVWASRWLRKPITMRLAGSDTLEGLLPIYRGSLFLWGGKPGVATRAAQRVASHFPHVQIVGTASGYYEASEETDIINTIERLQPRLVLLGLGSPRQELLMQRVYQVQPQSWYMTVGGMIDVLAGDVGRAPKMWRRWGVEWLYRGLREPQRMQRWPNLARFVRWAVQQK